MNRRLTLAGLAATAAAGTLTALAITPTAAAYSIDQLASLGYSVTKTTLSDGCHTWKAGYGNVAAPQQTSLGSDCDTDFQQRVDAFVAATCPCAQTTTTAAPPPPETTPTTTTTETPAPTPTTTTATTTTTTPDTTPVTTTEAIDQRVSGLEARIAALEDEIKTLATRVDRVVRAGDVAWLAFQQAILDGRDAADAADIARGTYLNAVNGLGEFA